MIMRLLLRRRSREERHALSILREAAYPGSSGTRLSAFELSSSQMSWFERLAQLATENRLVIRPSHEQSVGFDELQILIWLARAQRKSADLSSIHLDAQLVEAIVRSASILRAIEIRLPYRMVVADERSSAISSETTKDRATPEEARISSRASTKRAHLISPYSY